MENITCLFNTFPHKHATPNVVQIKKLQAQFDDLLAVMSADLRDWLIDGCFACVYIIGVDLVVETELCGGAVVPGKRFDSKYQVVTMALSDALDFSLSV